MSKWDTSLWWLPSAVLRYGLAVFCVVGALLVGELLHHLVDAPPWYEFLAAVMISTWVGGLGPGALAVLLSTVAVDYFFVPPLHTFSLDIAYLPRLGVFGLSALLISWLTTKRKRAETSLRQAHDELEAKVQERTAALQQTNEALQTEIAERKRAEEALHKAQAERTHLTRVMTMGELAASIAHEVSQPLIAVITNATACSRWLAREPPNLDEAREAVRRMIRDGNRASEVIARIRALLRKAEPQKVRLAINRVIGEVIALAQSEVRRNRVSLQTDLAADLPPVLADRIQLQQVILNLLLNGIDAMSSVTDRSQELIVRSQRDGSDAIRVGVQDSGAGIEPQHLDRIFTAFFTTKLEGLGMGLPISRSIIEAHGGRLWATPNAGPGVTAQFTLPTSDEDAS